MCGTSTSPTGTRSFRLDLQANLEFAVIRLLGKALELSQWNIGAVSITPDVAFDSVDEIDFAPDAARPTYLN